MVYNEVKSSFDEAEWIIVTNFVLNIFVNCQIL
jgi:hypothetical protein